MRRFIEGVEDARPVLILLLGSVAREEFTQQSTVDGLVVFGDLWSRWSSRPTAVGACRVW